MLGVRLAGDLGLFAGPAVAALQGIGVVALVELGHDDMAALDQLDRGPCAGPDAREVENGLDIDVLGTFYALVAGHVVIVIPWIVRLVTASLAGVDRATEEAAQNLGANAWVTFRRITLPAIAKTTKTVGSQTYGK